jgi:predicted DNA-binding protein (UPF0251 family)
MQKSLLNIKKSLEAIREEIESIDQEDVDELLSISRSTSDLDVSSAAMGVLEFLAESDVYTALSYIEEVIDSSVSEEEIEDE